MLGLPHGFEWIIILGIALLVFGNRLPSLGKSLGKGIVEFKKGLKGLEDEVGDVRSDINAAGSDRSGSNSAPATTAPRQIEGRSHASASMSSNKQKQEA